MLGLMHESFYEKRNFVKSNNQILFSTGYAGYPVVAYHHRDVNIVFEGMIYSARLDEVEQRLRGLAEMLDDLERLRANVMEFIQSYDGEFIVALHSLTPARCVFFNDLWGRLPFFYATGAKSLTLSREMKYCISHARRPMLNLESVSDILAYGYVIGSGTLLQQITRLEPATMLVCDTRPERMSLVADQLVPPDFATVQSSESPADHVAKLADIFWSSLRDRKEGVCQRGLGILTDVSGGYDTRTVFAGLTKLNATQAAFTKALATGDESDYALQLGRVLGAPVQSIAADHSFDVGDASRLLVRTDGWINAKTTVTNYIDSHALKQRIGYPAAEFMGFGGEFWRHPYRPKPYHASPTDFLSERSILAYRHIPGLLRGGREWRRNHEERLKRYFSGYREEVLADKIKHLYFEYYRNQVGLGEDRHRIFFWTVQPLQSSKIFDYANKAVPPDIIDTFFYIKFMRRIDPTTCAIPIFRSPLRLHDPNALRRQQIKTSLLNWVLDRKAIYQTARSMQIRLGRYPHSAVHLGSVTLRDITEGLYAESSTLQKMFTPNFGAAFTNMTPDLQWQAFSMALYASSLESQINTDLLP